MLLLGINELCKVTNTNNLETLVNSYKINPKHFSNVIEVLKSDSSFSDLIEDEFFQTWVDCMTLEIDELNKGSVSSFL